LQHQTKRKLRKLRHLSCLVCSYQSFVTFMNILSMLFLTARLAIHKQNYSQLIIRRVSTCSLLNYYFLNSAKVSGCSGIHGQRPSLPIVVTFFAWHRCCHNYSAHFQEP
jgi:hypothetical protein